MSTGRIFNGVAELVGNTPLVRLSRLSGVDGAEICAKLEAKNPSGSVKDRPALAMLRAAERAGQLKPGDTVVEATSGNTGISLAMLSAVHGYRCVLVMPEDMAPTRQGLLRAYGTEIRITPAEEGMRGAVEEAVRLLEADPRAFMPRQFENPENSEAHAQTTAIEVLNECDGKLDAIVAGVGTGGTLTGLARVLKREIPGLRVVAVEPKQSAVLSGKKPGLHGLYGLGAGFVPSVLDRDLIDEVQMVSDQEAERVMGQLAKMEGLLVGPSSGANVHVALRLAKSLGAGKRIVTILCDTGERYLS